MTRRGSRQPCLWGSALVALGLSLTVSSTAAQKPLEPMPPDVSDSLIQRGSVVFRGSARCDVCHGAEAGGTEDGPDLTDDKWLRGGGTFEEILERVLHGMPRRDSKTGKPMPMRGWEPVSDEDARAVAAYVWSLSHHRSPP